MFPLAVHSVLVFARSQVLMPLLRSVELLIAQFTVVLLPSEQFLLLFLGMVLTQGGQQVLQLVRGLGVVKLHMLFYEGERTLKSLELIVKRVVKVYGQQVTR